MDDLDLSEEALRRVLAACRWLRLPGRTPDYLREFLARRLVEAGHEGLAARVRGFADGQVEALAAAVRRHQRPAGPA